MTFIPDDPDHENHVIDLLQEILTEMKRQTYLIGQIVDIDTLEDDFVSEEDL